MRKKLLTGMASASPETRTRVGKLGGIAPCSKPKGFAAMSPEQRRKAGRKGGKTNGKPKGFAVLSKSEVLEISRLGHLAKNAVSNTDAISVK